MSNWPELWTFPTGVPHHLQVRDILGFYKTWINYRLVCAEEIWICGLQLKQKSPYFHVIIVIAMLTKYSTLDVSEFVNGSCGTTIFVAAGNENLDIGIFPFQCKRSEFFLLFDLTNHFKMNLMNTLSALWDKFCFNQLLLVFARQCMVWNFQAEYGLTPKWGCSLSFSR